MEYIIPAIVSVAVIYLVYLYLTGTNLNAKEQDVISGTISGRQPYDSSLGLNESYDQKEGIAFSYTCWIRVDDYTYRYGKKKVVFVKGATDLSAMCPGVFLDSNTNDMLIELDTFGSRETISIPNLPAKKWFHLALVVTQESVDVYVNGTLKLHHTLTQMPRQNPGTVHVGIEGGFDGKISGLKYYNYAITASDLTTAISQTPKPSEDDVVVLPPYFDLTWWIGRK